MGRAKHVRVRFPFQILKRLMDSSTVEHYTDNVEGEVHRFLKNGDQELKPGLLPATSKPLGLKRSKSGNNLQADQQ